MKNQLVLLACLFLVPVLASGQKKVKENDIIGTWKLVILIDDDEDEDDEDYENRDVDESFLGHVLSSGIKALVFNIIDDIDVRFEFHKDGTLEVYAMGEREDDETRWYINSAGELVINDDDDRDRDDDDIWLLKDGKLQAYERRGSKLKEKDVYLEKIKK